MATFTEELGKLAAEAIDKRAKKVEEEKGRLRPHIEKEWNRLRSEAVDAANSCDTEFVGTIETYACKFTVFKPLLSHVRASLPDELMAVNKGKGPGVCYARGHGTSIPTFELRFEFGDSVNENLAKLKRDRAAAEDKDKDKEEDAAAKRGKVEQKVKGEQKGK